MDTNLLNAHPHAHRHAASRLHDPHFQVLLLVTLLALSACAAFAITMTNGPDFRAAAAPAASVGGTTETVLGASGSPDASLGFAAEFPEGPLVIGSPERLLVIVTNPHEHDVRLDTLAVDVGEPAAAGCRAEWLTVEDFDAGVDGELIVPVAGTVRVPLEYVLADLPDVNQDACQGARFPLTITGSGRPAG